VILAMLQVMRRMASSVEVQEMNRDELARELATHGLAELPAGVLVYAVEGPFFFGAVETFEHALATTHTDPRMLIIRLKWVPFMDITGLHTLEEVIRKLHARGVRVMISGANDRVKAKLERAGIIELLGPENFFKQFPDAIATLRA
jgi:sulfate permease, SulP family